MLGRELSSKGSPRVLEPQLREVMVRRNRFLDAELPKLSHNRGRSNPVRKTADEPG